VSKAAGELYLGYYQAQYGLQSVSLRYANVYGPRQNPHGEAGVVAIFSQRLVAAQGCTIFGEGRQSRDFVYGPDVARANYLAFEKDVSGPINIGTGVETDINTLYRLLADAAGVAQGPVHAPAKPGEQLRSCVDATRARAVLGWSPSMGLAEGLRETLRYFREKAAAAR